MNVNVIAFAIDAHHKTNHLYDHKPYAVHLAIVAQYAMKYIACVPVHLQDAVLSACWLHDTIEDCRLSYNDIVQIAGKTVADIVYALTNEKGKNRQERANESYYHGIRTLAGATFVKLCDRLANIKYASEMQSRMLAVYSKEHPAFIENVLCTSSDRILYRDLLSEMDELLVAK